MTNCRSLSRISEFSDKSYKITFVTLSRNEASHCGPLNSYESLKIALSFPHFLLKLENSVIKNICNQKGLKLTPLVLETKMQSQCTGKSQDF